MKKLTNKEVWGKWIDYYNQKQFSCTGKYDTEEINERFFSLVPKEQRNLMAALISCLKWHPDNKIRKNGLCGLCFVCSVKCEKCPLYKKTKQGCTEYNSLFEKADKEQESKNPGKYSQKFFNTLLEIYKKEYKKVFGKDWVDWEKTT